MTLNENIEKCKSLYKEALKLKDLARVSDYALDKFKLASEKYGQAAQLIEEMLSDNQLKDSDKIRSEALSLYYRYEENDCLYGFEYKNGNYPKAIEIANIGKASIDKSLVVIDTNRNNLDSDTKEFLERMEANWKSSAISICIKQVEPIAKEAMIQEDYITAFDNFNKMLKLQQKLYEYDEEAGLDQVYIRIAKGNYIGMTANVNQALAGIISNKISNQTFEFDLTKDLLGHFLKSLKLSLTAFEANPEWDKYRSGTEIIKSNIKTLLYDNKNYWLDYLIEYENDKYIHKIMRETDNNLYKRQQAKLEIEQSKIKNFLLVGGFYVALAFGVFYILFQFAISEISWYKFVGILFGFPLFFTVIGAFILRTTDSLKEENFIKLITLALKINLSGLKVLTRKKEDKQKE